MDSEEIKKRTTHVNPEIINYFDGTDVEKDTLFSIFNAEISVFV